MQYLSDEWIESASAAMAEAEPLSDTQDMTVEYRVLGAPGGKRTYRLVVANGAMRLAAGADPDAEVGFELDYHTAVEIARGELSTQVAFMQGRVKLTGDVNVLIRRGAALSAATDTLAELRDTTEF